MINHFELHLLQSLALLTSQLPIQTEDTQGSLRQDIHRSGNVSACIKSMSWELLILYSSFASFSCLLLPRYYGPPKSGSRRPPRSLTLTTATLRQTNLASLRGMVVAAFKGKVDAVLSRRLQHVGVWLCGPLTATIDAMRHVRVLRTKEVLTGGCVTIPRSVARSGFW